MYGALQGLNKSETAAKHGEEQVKVWLFFCGVAYLIAFNTVTRSANHLCYAIFDNLPRTGYWLSFTFFIELDVDTLK